MADSTILDEEDPDQAGMMDEMCILVDIDDNPCLLYTSPSPRDVEESRMPSSA